MKKIGIVILYFGRFPKYFPYFLASCTYNRQINWLLFTDQEKPVGCCENIFYNYLNITNFNQLSSEKLEFSINITNPYKLCDLRPAYGKIFEDFLAEYEFWGYCDADLIFGNILKFITNEMLESYEIFSGYSGFLSGPFCLYKNNGLMKNFFQNCPNYRKVMQNKRHLAFDENIGRKEIEGFSLKKIATFLKYVLIKMPFPKQYFYSIREFRYGFQWYFKNKNISKNNPIDMTEAIHESIHLGKLKASFTHLIYSDFFFRRIGRNKWNIKWNSGTLTDMKSGKEIFAFHFPFSKEINKFNIEPYISINNIIIITESGITNV